MTSTWTATRPSIRTRPTVVRARPPANSSLHAGVAGALLPRATPDGTEGPFLNRYPDLEPGRASVIDAKGDRLGVFGPCAGRSATSRLRSSRVEKGPRWTPWPSSVPPSSRRAPVRGTSTQLHFPRPVTAYWAEMHPEPFSLGYGDMMAFYGAPFETRVTAYVNGFCYGQMRPVPPEAFPDRVQRAAEVFEGKLWREQAREWDEVRKPASVQAHHEIQAVDPDRLSDEALVDHLRRCHDHHAAMIRQHMAFTGTAVIPPGDFLVHASGVDRSADGEAARSDARRVADLRWRLAPARGAGRGVPRRPGRARGPRRGRGARGAARAPAARTHRDRAGRWTTTSTSPASGCWTGSTSRTTTRSRCPTCCCAPSARRSTRPDAASDVDAEIAEVRSHVPEEHREEFDDLLRGGAHRLQRARRARCLLRHLGVRADAPRGAGGGPSARRAWPAARRRAHRVRGHRRDVRAGRRGVGADGRRAGRAATRTTGPTPRRTRRRTSATTRRRCPTRRRCRRRWPG